MQSLAQAEGGANADEDSHEVVNVSSTDPAPTSDFDEYLNSLHSAAAESSTSTAATADINAFSDALTEVERLGRLRQPSVWDIISKYPLIVQPVSQVISCLPSTQVSVERMFSHLKLVLRENRVRMGTELTDAIVFMRTNKSV